jgi:predicted Fe-S protein YdhL (DUF1289 family)
LRIGRVCNKFSTVESIERDIPSPCTSVCELSYDRGLCLGCLRTLDEIARWGTMTRSQRRAVLERIARRGTRTTRGD